LTTEPLVTAAELAETFAAVGYDPDALAYQSLIDAEVDSELATTNGSIDDGPVFLDAYDFVNQKTDPPTPLWGNDDAAILAAGGLSLLAGRPGAGKTTWILDLACHLAAGLPYPPIENDQGPTPWHVPRPLNVALIENEGPQEMFRVKLQDKLTAFPHDIRDLGGSLHIQTWLWGSFSFADRDASRRAATELDQHQVDLVIGDPLSSLGPAGVGSPSDTRDFVACLRPLGLGTNRAFFFLHHFRERIDRTEDELARISGAWGGHLDTLLTLTATHSDDQARLAYPKLRWARKRRPNPIVLGRVWNTMSFVALAEEGDATILEPDLYEHLATNRANKRGRKGQGWQTGTELAKDLERRRVDVKKALEGAPHMFVSLTGVQAKALGAKSNAVLWGLKEWVETETVPPEAESLPF
jgi:hypothetical protein